MEIIAYHGWGFDGSFWKAWKKIIPKNISFKTANRGYFNEKKNISFTSSNGPKILIVHSFGLHWCPTKQIENADCIVIFNGFRTFHPDEASARIQSEEILGKMISAFKKNPQKVLEKFWENTFYPSKQTFTIKSDFDDKLLLNDLEMLSNSLFTPSNLKEGKPIISVDGGKDKILGKPRGKEFTELTKRDAVYHFIKEAGHALPVTHATDCWSFLSAMIPIFRNNGNYRKQGHQ